MPVAIDFAATDLFMTVFSLGFLLGYAEIHYRIPFIPSRYFRRQPEIIADLPCRVELGSQLPLLLIIKDADRFQVKIQKLTIRIKNRIIDFTKEIGIDETVSDPFWEKIFEIESPRYCVGLNSIFVTIHYQIGTKLFTCQNDNYRRRRKKPFKCYFGIEPLPLPEHFVTGDLHTHSNYTSDQLEFGASPASMKKMAQAMGHGFVGITDHSYDLDDKPDNFLENDPKLEKWRNFVQEVTALNSNADAFKTLIGEEVSCGNCRGENLHFIVLNCTKFLRGDGDGGEKGLRNKPALTRP